MIFNKQKHSIILFFFFLDNSAFRHICKHQITDLVVHNNDEYSSERSLKVYTKNVYTRIFNLFENLKHLTIVAPCMNEYPPLLMRNLSATTFRSTLTVLCINVFDMNDCLSILDGRFNQLNTFNVTYQCHQ